GASGAPRDVLDVGDGEKGVGGRLQPDEARLRADGGGHCSRVGHVHVAELQPVAPEYLLEQAVCAAIHIIADDHMVARPVQAQQRVGRGQAGGERQPVRAALQRGDVRLQRGACRVVGARVVGALVLAGGGLHVSGCLVDGRHDRAGGGVGLLPGMYGKRVEVIGWLGLHAIFPLATGGFYRGESTDDTDSTDNGLSTNDTNGTNVFHSCHSWTNLLVRAICELTPPHSLRFCWRTWLKAISIMTTARSASRTAGRTRKAPKTTS